MLLEEEGAFIRKTKERFFTNVKGTRIMTVYDLQLQLLKFQEEGLRLLQLCGQYPGLPVSSIPGYDAWLNNLYQYEQAIFTLRHLFIVKSKSPKQ